MTSLNFGCCVYWVARMFRFVPLPRSFSLRLLNFALPSISAARIHLRLTKDAVIVQAVGHTGYAVDEPCQRRGYATCSLRLIVALAQHYGIAPLRVLIEPENIASRRTAERAGFKLLDVAATRPEAQALGIGSQVCRYQSEEP